MVLIASIDQGTSSTRFLVFESDTGDLVTSHQIEVRQLFPNPGWVEIDPMEIIDTVKECIDKCVEKLEQLGLPTNEIKSIGITNQRETTILWDKETGEPLHNAIVWLDNRTAELAEACIAATKSRSKDEFKQKTGLPIHPYFSALKIRWLMQNIDTVKEAQANGRLLFGTVDTWIIWKLTGEHVTDVTNASRTLLFDLHKRRWSSQLCDFFEIPSEILPQIKSSAEIYGSIAKGPLVGFSISGCLGDQQAALIGHNCLRKGDTKITYGTGTFMLTNIGPKVVISRNGLLTTVGFQLGADSPVVYALEGSGSIGGNVVRFLRDNFGFVKSAKEMEPICRSVGNTEGVFFVPCFTGLYTPYWDPTARGAILGLTQVTKPPHICLAALRAVAYQSSEMVTAVEKDLGDTNTDGGMTNNVLFNELQAEIIGKVIHTTKFAEISGWGAAVAGGIGAQQISLEEFSSRQSKTTKYKPHEDERRRAVDFERWRDAVSRARGWVNIGD